MLFVIFILVLVAGIILGRLTDWESLGSWLLIVLGSIAVAVSLFAMAVGYSTVDGYVAACEARYESLVYQYENDLYENDNDVGKYELMSDIREWNEDLAKYQECQDNFWIGIYYPNIYDQFEPIALKEAPTCPE